MSRFFFSSKQEVFLLQIFPNALYQFLATIDFVGTPRRRRRRETVTLMDRLTA